MRAGSISAIIPTVGRRESLARLFDSLAAQSRKPDEILVADCSTDDAVARLCADPGWRERGLDIKHLRVSPPNAVGQRVAAIAQSGGDRLLLLDDDVVLAPDCVERLDEALNRDSSLAAAAADISNATWPEATAAWQWYMQTVLGLRRGEWHGRVVGPLLRFGYPPRPLASSPMQWFGTAHALVRRSAYAAAGGFSDFFLRRSTMNEDVDLSLRVARHGGIVLLPDAQLEHFHHPAGRVSVNEAAEDDLYNRYQILWHTVGRSRLNAFGNVLLFFTIESGSNFIGALRRGEFAGFGGRLAGRATAMARVTWRLIAGR